MNPQPFNSNARLPKNGNKPVDDPVRGTLISLAFWLCLLLAVGLYGLIVLSPKMVRWSQRQEEVDRNQQQLLALQDQVAYWDQLTHELETNQEFRESFRSSSRDAMSPSHGFLPVDAALRYHGIAAKLDPDITPQREASLLRICRAVASSRIYQLTGLAASAGILLFAFTSLVESRGPLRRPQLNRLQLPVLRRFRRMSSRYVSAAPVNETQSARSRTISS